MEESLTVRSCDLDLDIGLGHTAYRHQPLHMHQISFKLNNQKKFLCTDGCMCRCTNSRLASLDRFSRGVNLMNSSHDPIIITVTLEVNKNK